MNPFLPLLPCLILFTTLTGCKTTDEQVIMPKMQQNTYLSHTQQPQFFGYSAFRVGKGFGFLGEARLHPNHMAEKKLGEEGLPLIEMRGKSKRQKAKMLLDTSSPVSWMEFATSQKFNATFLGVNDINIPYRGGYNTGGVPAYAAAVSQMRINQLFMENVPLFIRMAMNSLGPLERGIKNSQVGGVLGYDNLQSFEYIQFDFEANMVTFSSSKPYIPQEDLLMTKAQIVNLPNYGLAVEGAVAGEPSPIILDVAGNYHFARGDVKVSVTKQVSIGDVVYRKLPTMLLPVSDLPPRAGRKMLQNYIITICPKKELVYFERFSE